MPEAVGSTFGGGLGGLAVVVLYLVLGPAAVIFHTSRWAFYRYNVVVRHRWTLKEYELQTIRHCLPWNVVITLIPALPALLNAIHH